MSFLFENLDVYQRAVEFAGKIHRLCYRLPRGSYAMADQLRRASMSISLNIAEGSGRFHKNDKKQFYIISRGSVYECVPLLTLLTEADLLDTSRHDELKEELVIISKMLAKLISRLS